MDATEHRVSYAIMRDTPLFTANLYQSTGESRIMAPKAKTTNPNVADNAVSPTPTVDNSKAVTIDAVSYDMSNLVDVVKLAVILNTMSQQQQQAYEAMRLGGIDETTIASLIGKGLESGVKSAVKEHLKPDYLAKWRAVTFEPIPGQSITVADYEARITTMIARLNLERESFVTTYSDSKIGEYSLQGGASRARGSKTQHDRNYDRLGAALIEHGIQEIVYTARNWVWPIRPAVINGQASAEFQYTGQTVGSHSITNRKKAVVDKASMLVSGKWYAIGLLNQANTELCEFNGWETGNIESVSPPNTWLACKVSVAGKLITLEAWYDEHIANDEDDAE
jgi:hypothetical protein